jgi:hypothetical protein
MSGGDGHGFHADGGEKRGKGLGIDGHKKRKGPKVHVLMNREGLPLSVAVGLENAHDRRKLEEVRGAFG